MAYYSRRFSQRFAVLFGLSVVACACDGTKDSPSAVAPKSEADSGSSEAEAPQGSVGSDASSQPEAKVPSGSRAGLDAALSQPGSASVLDAGYPSAPTLHADATSSAPDAGEGDVESSPDTPEVPLGPPWAHLYFPSGDGWMLNLNDPTQRVAVSSSFLTVGTRRVPWSEDGKRLVQVVEEEVIFYSLEGNEAQIVARYPVPGALNVYGWLTGYGPVIQGERRNGHFLAAFNEQAEELELGDEHGPYNLTIDPRGGQFFYNLYAEDSDPTVYRRSSVDGLLGKPEELATYPDSSATLSERWGPGTDWFAYTIFSEEAASAGLYFWRPGQTKPLNVTPGEGQHSPSFNFSRDGSLLTLFTYADDTSMLYTMSVGQKSLGTPHRIADGPGVSGGVWTRFGQLMYHDPEGGWLLTLDDTGAPTARIPFHNYVTRCDVAWLDATHFIQSDCVEGEDTVYSGTVDTRNEQVVVEEFRSYISRWLVSGECLLGSGEDGTLVLGPARQSSVGSRRIRYSNVDVSIPLRAGNGDHRSLPRFSRDGKYVLWSENNQLYRAPHTSCLPSEPELISELPEELLFFTFPGED